MLPNQCFFHGCCGGSKHTQPGHAFPSNARMSATNNFATISPKHGNADNRVVDLCHSVQVSAPLWILGLFVCLQSPASSSGSSRSPPKCQPLELPLSWRPLSYSHALKKRSVSPPADQRKNISVLVCEAGEPTVAENYMGRSGVLRSTEATSYMVATDFTDPKVSSARSVKAFQGAETEYLLKSCLLPDSFAQQSGEKSPLAVIKKLIIQLVRMSTVTKEGEAPCYSVDQLAEELEKKWQLRYRNLAVACRVIFWND